MVIDTFLSHGNPDEACQLADLWGLPNDPFGHDMIVAGLDNSHGHKTHVVLRLQRHTGSA